MLDTAHDLGSTLGRVPSVDHVTSGKRSKLQQGLLWGRKELQMFKLDLEKAEEPEIKLPTSAGSLKTQESSSKTSTSALLTMPKPLCGS